MAGNMSMPTNDAYTPRTHSVSTGPNGDFYKGNFKEGMRSGPGLYVCQHGKRRYEGEWKMSRRHGQGKETWPNRDTYEGGFVNDLFEGEGVLRTTMGKYVGGFKAGKKHGKGKMDWIARCVSVDGDAGRTATAPPRGSFGRTQAGQRASHRRSPARLPRRKHVYDGEWEDGKMHGTGEYTWPSGEHYKGKWENNMRNGRGVFTERSLEK